MPSAKRFAFAATVMLVSTAVGTALSGQAPARNNQKKAAAQTTQKQLPTPDFSSEDVSWTAINSDFTPVEGSPAPVTFDPKYPFLRNDQARDLDTNATYRVPDPSNPNL